MAQTTPKLGLAAWDQPLDPYNYQQLANNWNIIDFHDHTPGRGVLIPYGAIAPGAVGKAQLTGDVLGSRGAVQIATSQTISGSSYTLMAKPDQVAGLVLPTNGLIAVWYQATWQESVAGVARAAIFLGANQLKVQSGSAPIVQETATGDPTPAVNLLLATGPYGLASSSNNNYTGDVTTGQIVGSQSGASVISAGASYIFAAAGTYTVSVQFKASSGSVTALNRKLWVQAMSFN